MSRRTALGVSSQRNFTLNYSFEQAGFRKKVCKTFFMNTIVISETIVKTAIKKKLLMELSLKQFSCRKNIYWHQKNKNKNNT